MDRASDYGSEGCRFDSCRARQRSFKLLSHRHRGHVLLLGATASIISLLRQFIADPNMFKSIWAEDGWMPLCVVARGHGSCLFEPVNGYWPAAHRLLAEVFALLPMASWPVVFPVLAALMMGGMCATTFLAFRSIGQEKMGVVLAVGIPLIPALGIEFINVIGNIHWVLLIVTMLVMLMKNSNSTLLLTLVVVTSLTNPVSFVLVPLIGSLWFVGAVEKKHALTLSLSSFISWVIQFGMIVGFDGTDRIGFASTASQVIEVWSNSLLGVVPGLRSSSENGEGLNFVSTWLTPITVVLLTVAALFWFMFSNDFSLQVKKTAAFGVASQILTAFILIGFEENPRYSFVLLTLNAIWITAMVGLNFGQWSVVAAVAALVFLPLPAFKAGSYRTSHSQIEWSTQIRIARTECELGKSEAMFRFAPSITYESIVPCGSISR